MTPADQTHPTRLPPRHPHWSPRQRDPRQGIRAGVLSQMNPTRRDWSVPRPGRSKPAWAPSTSTAPRTTESAWHAYVKPQPSLTSANIRTWTNRCGPPPPPRFASAAHCPSPPEDASAPDGVRVAKPHGQYLSRALEAVCGDLLSFLRPRPRSGRRGQCEREDRGDAGVSQKLGCHRHRPARVDPVVDQKDRAVHRIQPLRQSSVDGQLLPHLCQA